MNRKGKSEGGHRLHGLERIEFKSGERSVEEAVVHEEAKRRACEEAKERGDQIQGQEQESRRAGERAVVHEEAKRRACEQAKVRGNQGQGQWRGRETRRRQGAKVQRKSRRGVIFGIWMMVFFMAISPLYAGKTAQEVALGNNLERWNLPVFNMGVGQAYAADARAAQAGFTNPAAVSRIAANQFSVEYQRWGEGWDLVSAALAHPMRGGGAFSTQVTWLDYGELEPDQPDALYRPQGNEFKAGLTYSQLLTDRLAFGVTGNVMTSKIDFDYDRETAGSIDAGAIFRMTPDFWIGAVGKNINASLKVDDKQNKLPPQYRAGVAWYLFQTRLGITADAVYLEDENSNTDDEQQIGVAGGLRFLYSPHVSLAVGYHDIYEDNNGLAGNLDFQFERFSFRLGYMREENGNIIRTGGTVNF